MQNYKEKITNLFKSNNFKIFLFTLVIGLSLFTFQVDNRSTNTQKNLPVPTPAVPYIERQQKKLVAIDELPYINEIFIIEYFPQDDTFWIKIKTNPYTKNQQLALKWFTDRKINPDDIQIKWTSVRGVAP